METKIITKVERATNRHWKNFVDKDYLGSHNLEPGEEMLLTIAKFVGEEEITTTEGKSTKQVIYFKENVPKMILNITNGNTLANLYGTHPDGWTGKKIQIYATKVKAFGKTQDALRIRDFVPKREVDVEKYRKLLEVAQNVEELRAIWVTFPASVINDPEMEKVKDGFKKLLTV